MTAAVGRFASGRPKLALLVWLAVIVPLSVAGIGVQSRLHDSGLSIDSSPSGKTTIATAKAFEPRSQALVVMHGPRPELERQRDALASRLRRERIALIGPLMTRGRDTELLVGEMRGPYSQIIDAEMPRLRAIAKASVRPPVSVYLGGYPDNGMAMVKGANEDIRRFELIAAPLLIVILLLIFRTPLAAAMPLAIGLTAIGATGGLLRLINGVKDLDVFAFSIGSMMALALGVDYALLLVSRFREERARGLAPPAAAAGAAATAGETVLTVGVILLCGGRRARRADARRCPVIGGGRPRFGHAVQHLRRDPRVACPPLAHGDPRRRAGTRPAARTSWHRALRRLRGAPRRSPTCRRSGDVGGARAAGGGRHLGSDRPTELLRDPEGHAAAS